MKISISTKLLPLLITSVIVTGFILGAVNIRAQKDYFYQNHQHSVVMAREMYSDLLANDLKMLKAAMLDFMTNQEFKNIFLENDRVKLYEATKELFASHQSLGITHFYFHRPNGTNFLRVHASSTFDDPINRLTLNTARTTNRWGADIELGKTAFALRAVAPYLNGSSTIGYLEYGEEISHINEMLKSAMNEEVVTIVDKSRIKADDWAAVTAAQQRRNNYDDMPNFVVVDTTDPKLADSDNGCWTEADLDKVNAEGSVFGVRSKGGQTYSCSGFALNNLANEKIGVIVAVKNITHEMLALKKSIINSLLIIFLIVTIWCTIVIAALNLIIANPLKKLTRASNKISDGEIDTPLPKVDSNDEIGDLSIAVESLVGAIKVYKTRNNQTKKR